MSSGGTITICGGNGEAVGPLTITFTHHKRADILLWATFDGLGPVKAAMLEHAIQLHRRLLAETIEHITGDEYYQHSGDPPPSP